MAEMEIYKQNNIDKDPSRYEFNTVKGRMESFFEEDSYINVKAVFLFGY